MPNTENELWLIGGKALTAAEYDNVKTRIADACWTITRNPRDLPEWAFVARLWKNGEATETHHCSQTLEELRHLLREDEGCELSLDRHPSDKPGIVETWI